MQFAFFVRGINSVSILYYVCKDIFGDSMVLYGETKIEMKEVISVAFEGAKINSLAVFG